MKPSLKRWRVAYRYRPRMWKRVTSPIVGTHTHLQSKIKALQNEWRKFRAEQLAIHQQVTAEAAANAKVTLDSLIAEAEAARIKAMSERGGAAAAVSALTAKAKLAGMWRDKVDQHNTGTVSTVWQVSWEDENDSGSSDGSEARQN